MDRQVSLNFSLREFIYSDTAIRLQIDNTPTDEVLVNLQNVCQFILEPVRNYFNKPITITSGYRSPELCKAIGSSVTSQHTFGQAVDFEILGIPNKEVSDWMENDVKPKLEQEVVQTELFKESLDKTYERMLDNIIGLPYIKG